VHGVVNHRLRNRRIPTIAEKPPNHKKPNHKKPNHKTTQQKRTTAKPTTKLSTKTTQQKTTITKPPNKKKQQQNQPQNHPTKKTTINPTTKPPNKKQQQNQPQTAQQKNNNKPNHKTNHNKIKSKANIRRRKRPLIRPILLYWFTLPRLNETAPRRHPTSWSIALVFLSIIREQPHATRTKRAFERFVPDRPPYDCPQQEWPNFVFVRPCLDLSFKCKFIPSFQWVFTMFSYPPLPEWTPIDNTIKRKDFI